MCEDRMFREEELLTDGLLAKGASMPALSAGLRMRVLAAAIEARDRRWQARRALRSALILFSFVGWAAWTDPLSLDIRYAATTDSAILDGQSGGESTVGAAPAASSAYCRRDMLISAMGDDWRMVEAEYT